MSSMLSKTFWIRVFFRLLGAVCIGAGVYGLQSFGLELSTLYKRLIVGLPGTVLILVVPLSFFLGAPSLIIMGIKLLFLRSFSHKLLFLSLFPVTFWFLPVYGFTSMFEMDPLLTFGVLFYFTYVALLSISFFVHTHWYTPQSHEKMGHVGTEIQDNNSHTFLRIVLIIAVTTVLLVLHPTDFMTTLDMLASPARALLKLFY